MKEIHDLGSFTQKKERENATEKELKTEGNAAPVQIVFALFIAGLIYLTR